MERIVKTRTNPSSLSPELTNADLVAPSVQSSVTENETLLRAVFDSSSDLFFLVNLDGYITEVNHCTSTYVGYSTRELVGRSVTDFVRGLESIDGNRGWGLLTLGVHHSILSSIRRRDGRIAPAEVRYVLVPWGDGDRVVIVARCTESLDQRSASSLNQRHVTQWERGTESEIDSSFISNFSHEMRTPLNAVIGMTDLLANTKLTRKQSEYVNTIHNSGAMLLRMIDGILDFAKIEAGALKLDRQTFAISDVIESVLELLGQRASSKNIELVSWQAIDRSVTVIGDQYRLQEVLLNLVCNAIKFTDKGEVVIRVTSVSETEKEALFRFEVQDTGIGIAPELVGQLYEPFTTMNRSTLRQRGGAGLGLAISKQLLALMDGRIGFENRVDQGATFWFEVPFRNASRSSDLVIEKLNNDALENKRVLIVDDNHVARESLCRYVQTWGMHCATAADASDAFNRCFNEAVDERPYDVAIVDVHMPMTSGLSLARQIRANPTINNIPLVLLNAIAYPLTAGVVSALGYATCTNKPVLPTFLRHSLLQAVGNPAWVDSEETKFKKLEHATASPSGLSILAADDNPFNREVLRNMLELLGYDANIVVNGPAVLEAVQNNPYDMILLDCHMPDMHGNEVIAELRRQHQHVPVIIAVTANTSTEHQKRCRDAGVDAILAKPLRLEQLEGALADWFFKVDEKRIRRECTKRHTSTNGYVLDDNLWEKLRGQGEETPDFPTFLIDLFLSDASARLKSISADLSFQRFEEARRQVHGLKGGCLQLGAVNMASVCDALYNKLNLGNQSEADALFQRLMVEFHRVRKALACKRLCVTNNLNCDGGD